MTFEFGKIDECPLMETETVVSRSQDCIQTITFSAVPTSGSFTLTYDGQTTASIAWNAAASAVETALIALSNITDVDVTGNFTTGFVITFVNADGNADKKKLTATSSLLKTATAVTITVEFTGRGYDNLGNYRRGANNDTNIIANVQPLVGKELQQLPEYDKTRQHFYLYTKTAIYVHGIIVRETLEYEIINVEAWRGYYKALIALIDNQ